MRLRRIRSSRIRRLIQTDPLPNLPRDRAMLARGHVHRCETSTSIPLDAIRCSRDTPIWKLEGCSDADPAEHDVAISRQST